MYLKEISATGFKSFADKFTINLNQEITAIVGPNGSGKSNIVDAVRWVLGEQSVKSLRGEGAMTDVIFSGSKNRKALNLATVSLIFDNSDNYLNIPSSEVSIKRRVYASGENQYFINGESCRLKDINELFLDSGMGKYSYNIVSQGSIDQIILSSNKDRRVVIEEAAGVLKYKSRKEEALNKLNKTENNLIRIRDIISELELLVKPLEEQSKKATEYLSYKDELEEIEIALLSHEIKTMNYSLNQNREIIESLDADILNLNVHSSNDDANIIKIKEEALNLNNDIHNFNQSLIVLTKKEEEINTEKKLFEERAKYQAGDLKVYENIKNAKEKHLVLENEIYSLKEDLSMLNLSIVNEGENLKNLETNLDSSKRAYNNSLNELNTSKAEVFATKEKIKNISYSLESGAAYFPAVRAVLQNPRLRGIHDVFERLLKIDKEYSKALEVAILSTRQFVVCETANDAKMAINYVKENKLGRLSFFPLDSIRPRSIDYETTKILKEHDGFIAVFLDLVEYDSKYHSTVANQLGNVILVRDLDAANALSKKINNRYRIVTLDGEVINVGGSITGGSLNLKSSFKAKEELEHLKQKELSLNLVIKELEKDADLAKKDLDEKENLVFNSKSKLTVLKERLSSKEGVLTVNQNSLESLEKEISNLDNINDSSVSKEEEKIMKRYYEVQREQEQLRKNHKTATSRYNFLNEELDKLDYKNKESNKELKEKEKKRYELELKNSKMEVQIDNYLNVLNEDYSLTFEAASSKYFLELSLEDAKDKVKELKNNIKDLGMVNLASIEEYERIGTRYKFLSEQESDLIGAKTSLLEIVSEMDEVMKTEFKETFKKLEKEFKIVFKELFGGGFAELKLTDPNNLLETGVEIVASPPGKTLSTINLLSGGEKTLTAISLILAILNIRPVPFCLFDEIEASLDESNVDKFGNYLKRYKDKTQFLIITHKKKTMEYADSLYGITMQESGVSTLVSVRLE